MVAIARALLWLSAVIPCQAFVNGRLEGHHPSVVSTYTEHKKCPLRQSVLPELRGGATALNGAGDYSGAARALFGNLVSPAAMLTGGLVPLGFLAAPLPDDTPINKKLRCLYSLLAVLSLVNELMVIIYATIASNKLTETVIAPASSVYELIKRDFELPWIAVNVHFLCGLFGFMSLVGMRAYTLFPKQINTAAAGFVGSALFIMSSIVNRRVSGGAGQGKGFGNSILSLMIRYAVLLYNQWKACRGVMTTIGILLGIASMVQAFRALSAPES